MTACPDISGVGGSVVVASAAARAERVVSVSPSHTASFPVCEADHDAHDERIDQLHALIHEAAASSHRLAAHIAQAGIAEQQLTQAAMELQQRLRLSAEMLAALQTLIARVEQMTAASTKVEASEPIGRSGSVCIDQVNRSE